MKSLQPALRLVEKETMSLLAGTEEEFAIIRWFHNNKELSVGRKRNQRLKITTAGTMHFFCLERCTPADSGVYTAKTNCDETTCEVAVAGKISLLFFNFSFFFAPRVSLPF